MAWVERRGSSYLVRWRDSQGRKKQRFFRVREDARAFAASHEPRRNVQRQSVAGPSLAGYLEKTLAAAEDIRESTRYHYGSLARKHIAPALGHRAIADIDADDIRRFLGAMRAHGYSAGYRSVARSVLARTFKLATTEGLVLRNPLDAVPAHRRDTRTEVRPLEVHEVEAIASAILPRYRAAVFVMAYAGLRVGEVGALTISAVNLVQGVLHVRATVARAGGRLVVTGPKTPAAHRAIPLPQFVAHEMRHHINRFGLSPDGRVFHTPGVNQHRNEFGLLHSASLHKPFKAARTAARLPLVHPHTLRHTYAALLIREAAHPKVIQTLMGHSSITVTMDLYGHLFPGIGQDLANRLDIVRKAANAAASWPVGRRGD